MTFLHSPRRTVCCVVLTWIVAARLCAQVVAPATVSKSPPVVLSPFEVREQSGQGYRAAAAITGTGTAGLIKDTPLNISIVADELVRDKAGNQLVDILRGASAVALHVKDESQILVRGYTGPQFVNGLPAGTGLALYDVDRVEVVKGPNAVFAGISNPGGTVNLIKLKPSFTARNSVDVSVGSFAHRRGVLHTSGPLVRDTLAYGLVLGRTDESSDIDYMFTRENFGSGGLTWKPAPALAFTARYSQLDREAGRRSNAVASHPLFQQRDREAMERFDRAGLARPADYPQLEDGAVRDPAGRPIATARAAPEGVDAFIARTLGPNVAPYPAVYTRELYLRETANANGPDGRDNYANQTTTLEGEWVASPVLALRGVFQHIDSHRLRREFNGLRPVAGQRLRSSISDFKPGGVTFAARLEAAGKLDLGRGGRHDVLAGFQHDGGKDAISPITVATTRIVIHNPRIDAPLRLLQLLRDQYGAGYEEPGVVRKGGAHSNAIYGILQSSFVGDRLRTLLGGRAIENHRPTDDNRDGRDEDFVTRKFLPQIGALWRVAPALSVYGSFSKTFVPQRQQTADLAAIRGTQGEPTSPGYRPPAAVPVQFLVADLRGQGREAGVKLELGDGRLLGTVSYFANEEAARLDVDTANQVLFQLPGGTVRTPAGRSRAEGVESEWVWTPRAQWQALLSASWFFEKNEISNPSDAREVGSHLESVPRYTVNVWNRFTFATGALRGAYLGGGLTAIGETYEHPSWTVPIKSEPVVLGEVMIGYTTKVGRAHVEWRLNVRNVGNQHYLNGTFHYGEPRTAIGSMSVRF